MRKLPHNRLKYIGFWTTGLAIVGATLNVPFVIQGRIVNIIAWSVCVVCAFFCGFLGKLTWDLYE